MKEEAYLAFRELQSRGMISSSTSGKDEDGNIRAYEKVVFGPIASMSCTTKGEGGLGLGILMGGTANVIAGYGAGDLSSGYGVAQHFVGGGLSSITGRQLYRAMGTKWKFNPGADKLDGFFAEKGLSSRARKALSYGAQNVAARFAYTDRKYFTNADFFNHMTGFGVGATLGYMQYELMSGDMLEKISPKFRRLDASQILRRKLAYSTGLYGMEYAMNSSLIYNRQN
ncbi:hypothetical protein [Pararhodonellum marinum]|uniref:hypothetical protein n=1 Tax=Pararhodonellum marinum TaxID=2755358 RepID=UPI00188F9950|nr:hypothetical protein [Pararhodonellum marinum]